MPTPSEKELSRTRAAMQPTLDATAAVLPLLTKVHTDREIDKNWQSACQQLAAIWNTAAPLKNPGLRPTLLLLYRLAIQAANNDCLVLTESFASAIDRLESLPEGQDAPQLVAAFGAALEAMEKSGPAQEKFGERARHFSHRLTHATLAAHSNSERSAVIDKLFVEEALEHLQMINDALVLLSPDTRTMKAEVEWFEQAATQIELWGIMHHSRQLLSLIKRLSDEGDNAVLHRRITENLRELEELARAV